MIKSVNNLQYHIMILKCFTTWEELDDEADVELGLELELELEVVDAIEVEVSVAELELTTAAEVVLNTMLEVVEAADNDKGSELDSEAFAEAVGDSIDETADKAVETGLSIEDSPLSMSRTLRLYVVGTASLLTCNHGMV